MNIDFFANILDSKGVVENGAASFWDMKAEDFHAGKRTYGTRLTEEVVGFLAAEGMLHGESAVLDVGAAYGRYALSFAAAAREVLATDVSSRMLDLCGRLAAEEGADNLSRRKHDWLQDETGDLEKRFDLVFAAMCAPARTTAGLKKMMAASKKKCAVAQYTDIRDDLLEQLADEAGADLSQDPHRGKDIAWAIFNWLWLQGLEPRIAYFERPEDGTLSIDEAEARYRLSLGKTAHEKGLSLRSMLERRGEGGLVRTAGKTSLALIHWEAPPASAD